MGSLFLPAYLRHIIKQNFANFYAVSDIPIIDKGKSVIVTPNHFSWWDGFFSDFSGQYFIKRKFYLMMLEEQLRKYWFFQKIGAFGIEPGNVQSLKEVSKYIKQILSDHSKYLVFYPQGEIQPYELRPLSIKKGIQFFLKGIESSTLVIPLGFKIHYLNEKYPSVYFRYGDILTGEEVNHNFDIYLDAFYDNLDKLNHSAFDGNFNFDLLEKI